MMILSVYSIYESLQKKLFCNIFYNIYNSFLIFYTFACVILFNLQIKKWCYKIYKIEVTKIVGRNLRQLV